MRIAILVLLVAGFAYPIRRCEAASPSASSLEQFSRWSGLWFPETGSSWYFFENWRSALYASLWMRASDCELFLKTNGIDAAEKIDASSAPKSFFEKVSLANGMAWLKEPPKGAYFLSSAGGSKRLDVMVLVETHAEEEALDAQKERFVRVFVKAARFSPVGRSE